MRMNGWKKLARIVGIVGLVVAAVGCCEYWAKKCEIPCKSQTVDRPKVTPGNPIQVGPGGSGNDLTYLDNTVPITSNPYNTIRDDFTRGVDWMQAILTTGPDPVDIVEATYTVRATVAGATRDVKVTVKMSGQGCLSWGHDQTNISIGTCDASYDPCKSTGIPVAFYGPLKDGTDIMVKRTAASAAEVAQYFKFKPNTSIAACNP